MSNSYFFLQASRTETNGAILEFIEEYAKETKEQIYVIKKPLGEGRYNYSFEGGVAVLVPKHKITFISFGGDAEEFEQYCEDFIEDVGSLSDKFEYKNIIGRPRRWKEQHTQSVTYSDEDPARFVNAFLASGELETAEQYRICDLLTSLITCSINDVSRIGDEVPQGILDSIKRKIVLFDGDQTRFIYQNINKPTIRIQGLSGTGKTELLLHKLKEIYTDRESPNSRIAFTCHNKILAHSLRTRVPNFFNFMKVEQQIKWNERLWCVGSWGSRNDPDSGIYRHICDFYSIPFLPFSYSTPFGKVCEIALKQIKETSGDRKYAFDYTLIDESQDFTQEFFALCEYVTSKKVIIAGDIFQSIFDDTIISEINPDFLLSKCYRTDPRTLMFAHALGMGLFENKKLRWLEDREWSACGYLFDIKRESGKKIYHLTREPLKRFEDMQPTSSVEIIDVEPYATKKMEGAIFNVIERIKENNPTVQPGDIGVIFVDEANWYYSFADRLEATIKAKFDWKVNKAYETKSNKEDEIFVSNRNNVKGLEFPFVICISMSIENRHRYRNTLYTMLTRSFITTYFITSSEGNESVYNSIVIGLAEINKSGTLVTQEPTDKASIKTTIEISGDGQTWQDFMGNIFDSVGVKDRARPILLNLVRQLLGECFDEEKVTDTVEYNYRQMYRPVLPKRTRE